VERLPFLRGATTPLSPLYHDSTSFQYLDDASSDEDDDNHVLLFEPTLRPRHYCVADGLSPFCHRLRGRRTSASLLPLNRFSPLRFFVHLFPFHCSTC
jgi:hypothetical protein